jgi:hypothetical protein
MARWLRRLDIADEWQAAKKNKITVQELARKIADKLVLVGAFSVADGINIEENVIWANGKKAELIDWLYDFAEDVSASKNDFDVLMAEVYHWADATISKGESWFDNGNVCWINTIGRIPSPKTTVNGK